MRAEWHKLREVVVHRPGIEMFFGTLEPFSFLYDRFFSMDEALFEHRSLEHTLHKMGADVHRLKRLFIQAVTHNSELRASAARVAIRLVRYLGSASSRGPAYLNEIISEADPETLFNILLLSPVIEARGRMSEADQRRIVYPFVTLEVPLANMYFLRDQQATTDTGIVYGRMAKPQRRREVVVTKMTFEGRGNPTCWSMRAPATFEGGDFMAAGEFALVGIGDRTNREAVQQLLRHGLSFDEVVVVDRPRHPLLGGSGYDPMLYMHLDTYLNMAGEGIAVGCGDLLDNTGVEVYVREGKNRYRKNHQLSNRSLTEYLRAKDFHVIRLSTFEQLAFASNFLTMDDRKILAVDVERNSKSVLTKIERLKTSDQAKFGVLCQHALSEYEKLRSARDLFPRKREVEEWGIDVVPLDLDSLTGGYGAARCMTATLRRG
ncbi:MAG: arginine deiminase family protein [Thermoprotei archaeon]